MIFEVGSLYVSFILQAKREWEMWPLACWTKLCPICLTWGRPKKWVLSIIQMHESHYLQWELTCTFLDSLIFPGQSYRTVVGSPQPFCALWSPHLAGWKADKAWAVWASPLQESPCSASTRLEITNSKADIFQTQSLTQGWIFIILFLFLKAWARKGLVV